MQNCQVRVEIDLFVVVAQGLCHKVAAISRVIDRYGAYITHLTAYLQDASVKTADKAKLKGYAKKWSDAKILLGCEILITMDYL